MSIDHAEIWLQAPPIPVQNENTLVQHPTPDYHQQKIAPDELLLVGMMLWMEQGLVLEWLHPETEKEAEEQKNKS